jgi:hypothetical protein
MPDFATFLEVLGRLYINGFEICTERMETYGWGVYLGPRLDRIQRRHFSSRFFCLFIVGAKSGISQEVHIPLLLSRWS